MEFGLIGRRLGHSMSPLLHSMIADYNYEIKELEPDELEPFFRKRDFRGLNVTIPYKQAVIPFLDELSVEAQSAKAVNTVVVRGGKLIGYNTDCFGFDSMLSHSMVSLRDRNVLILGSGGAAKAVRAVAVQQGAAAVANAVRHTAAESDACILYENLNDDWDVIVNATPAGMFPDVEGCPIDLNNFSRVQAVIDCIYNPLRTSLVLDANQRGLTAQGGLWMLVAQAFKAAELFVESDGTPRSFLSGVSLTGHSIQGIYRSLLSDSSNLVLIGMPSCGKTTTGRVLAARTGRRFVDCDDVARERIGMSIPDFFAREGETAFRSVEREVISEVSLLKGAVIATGGGAVLLDDNVRALRRSGTLIYLDTDLSNLTVGNGRPLSVDIEALRAMYELREPLYRNAADITVDNNCQADLSVSRILSCMENMP